jgi:hypothetical protein
MKTKIRKRPFARRGLVPANVAIVLAIITGGAGILACEWHRAHPSKQRHGTIPTHHHKQGETTASN